jgi:cathepsin L
MRVRRLFLAVLALWATAAPAPADALPKLRSRGAEIFFLDADLRTAYAKTDPNLPEASRKLPPATTPAFDWSSKVVMPHWLAQARTPYCWAFAAVTAFEWNWAIRNGGQAPALAIQPLLDRTKKVGAAPHKLALEELLAHGTCPPKIYPHVGRSAKVRPVKMTFRAIAWGEVVPDGTLPTVAQLKTALLEMGPLVVSVYTTKRFGAYRGGIFNEHFTIPKVGPRSNHSVVILGWDDRMGRRGCWKVQNSWGPQWGMAGFMWIEYGCNNIGMDACWVRPQSVHYQLPEDAHRLISGQVDAFANWSQAKKLPPAPAPELPTVTPADAPRRVGERIVLDFQVKSVALQQPAGNVLLASAPNLKDPGCVIVSLLQSDLSKFPVQEPQALFRLYRGKHLRVRGSLQPITFVIGDAKTTVLLLEVGEPRQIEVIERK